VAERGGFEPPVGCPTPPFQDGALSQAMRPLQAAQILPVRVRDASLGSLGIWVMKRRLLALVLSGFGRVS
jgi:hypothetical protein